MATPSKKCWTAGCHMHTKVPRHGAEAMRQVAASSGRKVALLCPRCVVKAIDHPGDQFDFSVPLGELVAVGAQKDPVAWYIVTLPNKA